VPQPVQAAQCIRAADAHFVKNYRFTVAHNNMPPKLAQSVEIMTLLVTFSDNAAFPSTIDNINIIV
jgi:hypothetical protein